jgi:hypothetical protein
MNNTDRRYRSVVFDPNWIEEFVLTAMRFDRQVLFSKSEFNKDKAKRSIIFHSLKRYCKLSEYDIGRRYSTDPQEVRRRINYAASYMSAEAEEILMAIEPHVPMNQFTSYLNLYGNNRQETSRHINEATEE